MHHFDSLRDLDDTGFAARSPAGSACGPALAARNLNWRRLSFVGPVASLALLGFWLAVRLTAETDDWLRWPLLALLLANLAHLSLLGWPGILGTAVRLLSRRRRMQAAPNGSSRTALVFPVYNEDPHTVFTAVEVMARAIAGFDLDGVDIFILSDTQDPALAAAEAAAYAALPRSAGPAIHYRRRVANIRRKAGNIADFCENHGVNYDYMVVLDADSLMTAGSIASMIGLMDANPRAGIIQTVPYPVGRETLFARAQQFAARLYGPLLVEGLAFWQQADSNYWGHNAIIRIAPFVAHCELPVLPGRAPFGGEILCHDVVEAALMRRGGWEVWVVPEIEGSYEALPANMVDFAQRERRWCQGNLQHLGVVGAPGLRPTGRYHLGVGVLNYLSGPLGVGFAALATVDAWQGGSATAALLGTGRWEHTALLTLVLVVLYGAKLCTLAVVLADREAAAGYGGRLRLLASAAVEQMAAMVTSPVSLVLYTRFIVTNLLGRAVGWEAQPRDDRGVSWPEALRCMRGPALAAAVWLAAVLPLQHAPLAWVATLLPGLLLAAPFAVITSRASLGIAARRVGLLVTPEETAPSAILRAYQRAMARPRFDGVQSSPTGAGRMPQSILGLRPAPQAADND